jgi:hypothetical protein
LEAAGGGGGSTDVGVAHSGQVVDQPPQGAQVLVGRLLDAVVVVPDHGVGSVELADEVDPAGFDGAEQTVGHRESVGPGDGVVSHDAAPSTR